jgi:hypothetical protein
MVVLQPRPGAQSELVMHPSPSWAVPAGTQWPLPDVVVGTHIEPTAQPQEGNTAHSVPGSIPAQDGMHAPQSAEQVLQLSLAWQVPSPQTAGQAPQSAGQVLQLSLA